MMRLRWIRRAALAISLSIGGLGLSPFPSPAHATTYSCSNYCYAKVEWYSFSNGLSGLWTNINTQLLSCSSSCGRIGNVTWLVQHSNTNCTNFSQNQCWIEAGHVNLGDANKDHWYFADNRPGSGSGSYNEYFLGTIPSAEYGHTDNYSIKKNTGTNNWSVVMAGYTQTWSGTSSNNSMTPDRVDTGLELKGTSGASAASAPYNDNEYFDSSGNAHAESTTSIDKSMLSQSPASGSYSTTSGTGGTLTTSCAC